MYKCSWLYKIQLDIWKSLYWRNYVLMQLWCMTWQNVLSHSAERMDVGSDRAIFQDADTFHSSRQITKRRKMCYERRKAIFFLLPFQFTHHQLSVEKLYFLEHWNWLDFKREIISIQVSTVGGRQKLRWSRTTRHLNVFLRPAQRVICDATVKSIVLTWLIVTRFTPSSLIDEADKSSGRLEKLFKFASSQ